MKKRIGMVKPSLKSLFRIYLAIVLSVFIAGVAAPAFAQPATDTFPEKVDAYIASIMQQFPIPGIAVGIVKGDQVLYLHGYGRANTNGDPVTPQTTFTLCSVTKTFTALAIHQLASSGKINLDAPLQTYIPEFRLADQHAASTITVRHLLDHKSGISQVEGEASYIQSPKATFEEALQHLARYRPTYQPGDHWEYSNWNYVLLGEVVARASGQSYTDYVQTYILDPLEMSRSSFVDFHKLPGAATGNLIVFGVSVPYDEWYIPALLGADGLSASAEDMTHYMISYLNQGSYRGNNILTTQGIGWYDVSWNWHVDRPDNALFNSFSGSHNAIQSNVTIFPLQKVGVVVMMNTRLDQLPPTGLGAWNIAVDIANITMNNPPAVRSNLGFYIFWGLVDGVLLLLITSIIWQAFKLKNWRNHYLAASRVKKVAAWFGIVFDLLLCVGIMVLPNPMNSRWDIILYHRPDFAFPLLAIGTCLGALGIVKLAMLSLKKR
jgi:CubicO group peptidase (beta-lactamase class C family)